MKIECWQGSKSYQILLVNWETNDVIFNLKWHSTDVFRQIREHVGNECGWCYIIFSVGFIWLSAVSMNMNCTQWIKKKSKKCWNSEHNDCKNTSYFLKIIEAISILTIFLLLTSFASTRYFKESNLLHSDLFLDLQM